MSSEITPPLFLSLSGYREAVRIFQVFREEERTSIRKAVDHSVSCLSKMEWSDYDDTYLSLYTLSLHGHENPISLVSSVAEDSNLPYRGTVEFMLDLKLRIETSEYKLLDERSVALFINFKKAVEGLVPFRMVPRAVAFGCIVVEFDILVPRLHEIDPRHSGAIAFFQEGGIIQSFFSGKEWDALTKRFHVADVAVHGLT